MYRSDKHTPQMGGQGMIGILFTPSAAHTRRPLPFLFLPATWKRRRTHQRRKRRCFGCGPPLLFPFSLVLHQCVIFVVHNQQRSCAMGKGRKIHEGVASERFGRRRRRRRRFGRRRRRRRGRGEIRMDPRPHAGVDGHRPLRHRPPFPPPFRVHFFPLLLVALRCWHRFCRQARTHERIPIHRPMRRGEIRLYFSPQLWLKHNTHKIL